MNHKLFYVFHYRRRLEAAFSTLQVKKMIPHISDDERNHTYTKTKTKSNVTFEADDTTN
jgi:hypothetical protein